MWHHNESTSDEDDADDLPPATASPAAATGTTSTSAATPAAAAVDNCCEVCLLGQRDGVALIVPCGHARFCTSCVDRIVDILSRNFMSCNLVVATRFLEYSVNLCTRLFLKPSYSVLLYSVSKWFTQFYFYQENKIVQQSWQTSALAMHLSLSRLVSMLVIFCLLPISSIVILVFYLFSTAISEQHVWELWV